MTTTAKILLILSVVLRLVFAYSYAAFEGDLNYEDVKDLINGVMFFSISLLVLSLVKKPIVYIWCMVEFFYVIHHICMVFSLDYLNALLVGGGLVGIITFKKSKICLRNLVQQNFQF